MKQWSGKIISYRLVEVLSLWEYGFYVLSSLPVVDSSKQTLRFTHLAVDDSARVFLVSETTVLLLTTINSQECFHAPKL